MIELKPCPFCGGEAEIATEYGTTARVRCKTCKCTTETYGANVRYCAVDKAAEIWNKRTYQPEEIEREFMRICESEMKHE